MKINPVIILLIILAVAAYFGYQNHQQNQIALDQQAEQNNLLKSLLFQSARQNQSLAIAQIYTEPQPPIGFKYTKS